MVGLEKSNVELEKILKNLEPATRIKPGEIQAILNNLRDVMANLESFSYSVKERPSSLLWGSPPKAKGESDAEKSARNQGDFRPLIFCSSHCRRRGEEAGGGGGVFFQGFREARGEIVERGLSKCRKV